MILPISKKAISKSVWKILKKSPLVSKNTSLRPRTWWKKYYLLPIRLIPCSPLLSSSLQMSWGLIRLSRIPTTWIPLNNLLSAMRSSKRTSSGFYSMLMWVPSRAWRKICPQSAIFMRKKLLYTRDTLQTKNPSAWPPMWSTQKVFWNKTCAGIPRSMTNSNRKPLRLHTEVVLSSILTSSRAISSGSTKDNIMNTIWFSRTISTQKAITNGFSSASKMLPRTST